MLDESCASRARSAVAGERSNVIIFPGHSRGSLAERARARRDWLMARWAAEQLGLDPGEARAYARRIAAGTTPQDTLIHRIQTDFRAAGVALPQELLFRKLDDFHIQASVWARCTPVAG